MPRHDIVSSRNERLSSKNVRKVKLHVATLQKCGCVAREVAFGIDKSQNAMVQEMLGGLTTASRDFNIVLVRGQVYG